MNVIQQRFQFPTPTVPVRLAFALSGVRVLVDVVDGATELGLEYLAAAGVVVLNERDLLSFPVRHLALLVDLPDHVAVDVDHLLRPLWCLISNLPDTSPAVVETIAGDLRLSWMSHGAMFDEVLLPQAVGALFATELPFVASADGWGLLLSSTTLPRTIARARVADEGFVELTASTPQAVEASPISGMFRIDDTRYGVPLAYVDEVVSAPGFVFESHVPRPTQPPLVLSPLLSPTSQQTASDLAHRLLAYSAAILVAPTGGSRRVTVSAALAALGARSVVVVCAPWALWPWKRALAASGWDAAVGGDAPVRLVTYRDITHGVPIGDPDALVWDDIVLMPPEVRSACTRLDDVGKFRVVVSTSWPESVEGQVRLAAHARPKEFRSDVPLVVRYPMHPSRRAFEHVRPYLVHAGRTPGSFARISVELVPLAEEVVAELDSMDSTVSPWALARAAEVVTCGVGSVASGKLAVAFSLVLTALTNGQRCVVLCRHRQFATLLSALCRPTPLPVEEGVQAVVPRNGSCIVVYDDRIPDLGTADLIVVADWPLSMSELDRQMSQSPSASVVIVHSPSSIDDRFAVRALMSATPLPYDRSEMPWLLQRPYDRFALSADSW